MKRLAAGIERYGIVHWGLNTFTDKEWGYGDEDPAWLNPAKFDADQIVRACKAGGLQGLVIVAKHHDGFCLWPTKTTGHNISKSPFRGGKGDYVREMEQACRRAGLKFGAYVSPWVRNSAHYATEKYVEIYHAQIKELLSGDYGEVFEMWFDGANGGDGWYGGAKERRRIGGDYYRFPEVFKFVRELQPDVCIFAGESDASDFRWPGNEKGELDPNSSATICSVGGYADGNYGNPDYMPHINTGMRSFGNTRTESFFRVCECDFPLRPGWFYHEREKGKTKSGMYLLKRYLNTVGNGGTMNVGIAPNRDGLLDDEDVNALRGFGDLLGLFFSREAKEGEPFNVVVMREDVSRGELVDDWKLTVDGREVLSGTAIGIKRIRTLANPVSGKVELDISSNSGEAPGNVSVACYLVDPDLLNAILSSTTESGETDTAKWMTAAASATPAP